MFLSVSCPDSSSLFPIITTQANPLELASSSCFPRLLPRVPSSLRIPASPQGRDSGQRLLGQCGLRVGDVDRGLDVLGLGRAFPIERAMRSTPPAAPVAGRSGLPKSFGSTSYRPPPQSEPRSGCCLVDHLEDDPGVVVEPPHDAQVVLHVLDAPRPQGVAQGRPGRRPPRRRAPAPRAACRPCPESPSSSRTSGARRAPPR